MKIFKLILKWQSSLLEHRLLTLKKESSTKRCYSDKPSDKKNDKNKKDKKTRKEDPDDNCGGVDVKRKHKLVPCNELDSVTMCIKESIQIKSEDQLPTECDEGCRVIIVGAGIAGLTAAARMVNSNLTDFIILEAKDRPGGRVKTAKFGDTLIDLGGEFIEGASIVNPVYQFACLNNLISRVCPAQSDNCLFLLSDSRAIKGNEKIFSAFNNILENIAVDAATNENYSRCNVFDYIELKMKEQIDSYPEWERDNAMRMVYSLINELRVNIAIDATLTSVSLLGSSITLPGPRMRFDQGGASYIEALLKRIPKDKIMLNKGVQTIFWKSEDGGDSGGIKVRCCDGSECHAQHIIVTVSLGALRCQNTLFSPSLPCDKMRAIHGIPFAKGAKLFLKYQDPFWLDKGLTLRFGWAKEELSDRQDWIKGIGSIEQVPSPTDHILKVTVGGREAQIMEQNRQDATSEFLDWLDNTVGTPLSTCVDVEAVATAWSNDIFTGGSNSYIAPCFQKVLAEPLPNMDLPRLIFAGEATEPGYIGSMHSAAKSGLRVADMLLNTLKIYDEQREKAELAKEAEAEEINNQIIETDSPCPPEQIKKLSC